MRIAVIGAGIAGTSVAFHAAQAGAEVILVDRDDHGQATAAGAGIICPWTSRVDDPKHYRLGAAGARYYPELIQRLRQASETDLGYRRTGVLCLGADASDAARIEELVRRRADQHPEAGEIDTLSGARARELFPPLRDDLPAVHVAGGARVDGRLLRDALRRAAVRSGTELLSGEADLVVDRERATGVRVDGEIHTADVVVAAAGAWTPGFLSAAPVGPSLEPQRGQITHLRLPGSATADWPVVQPPNRHYLVPFDDSRIVAGATRESGTGFDPRTTASGLADVLQAALSAAPGLADAGYLDTRVGLRPMSADGLPHLGWLTRPGGVAVATGFGPTGLTMAPFAGKLVADLALGHQPDFDLGPYDPARGCDRPT